MEDARLTRNIGPGSIAHAGPASDTGLPIPLTSFVGRESEVRAILARLDDQAVRLLTLTGPGGVGKTRLATEVTWRIAGDFADGVRYVSLASLRDPALAPATVARALGVHRSSDRPLLDDIANVLARRHMLLALDNFEQLLDSAPTWLASLLSACPRLKVLVTSRIALNIAGEHRYAVPPLSVGVDREKPPIDTPAVELFVQRARAIRPDLALEPASLDAIGELCRRLEGLPLAIELAAARVSVFTPEQLLRRFHDRFDLLQGVRRDASERQRSMRNAIAWSYDLLSPDEQRLFRQLSVFSRGFTLDAAGAVAEPLEEGIVAGVSALADHSLIRIAPNAGDTPRYAMLETVREYGRDRLQAAGEESATRERHARWFVAQAGRAKPFDPTGQLPWLRDLAHDQANIRAALTWLVDRDRVREVAAVVTGLRWYWFIIGLGVEGIDWADWVLDRRDRIDTVTVVDLLIFSSQSAARLGNDDATSRLDAAIELLGQNGDPLRQAEASFYAALAAENRGDYAAAEAEFTVAKARYAQAHSTWRDNVITYHFGILAYASGNFTQASARFEEVLAIAADDDLVTALCNSFLALIACAQGDPQRAIEHIRLDPLILIGGHHADDRIVLGSAAVVAEMLGDDEATARLMGAAGNGASATQPEQRAFTRAERAARERLGEARWQSLHDDGRRLRPDQIAELIERLRERQPDAPEPPPAPPEHPPLTTREADVLCLMASGMTNKQIADSLFISRKTVAHHVTNILVKLSVDSRTAAVSVAIRSGLA